ncbi:SIR2 family NAD-dependent protein deacylase [Acinetobacter johnsonii]|uniref:SIR2 family NAD-dependent protein deacylase n=1 Tax=Acinetobacter johnsonii TaxID=40214 RepID=UPI001F387CFF|nr:SIR2 family protein [Acinetobacter johnsonii]UIZ96979.1 SIR2 family protein [Acinetobacter johnsonii]
MSNYFDIAYAAVNNRLCFITGAGFTKAITNQQAPTWEDLLKKLCEKYDETGEFEKKLFQTTTKRKCPECDEEHDFIVNRPLLALDELAEIIASKLKEKRLDIYDEIKKIIEPLKISGDCKNIKNFFKEQSFRVVTTNYDKLIQQLCEEGECQTISPGMLIPRLRSKVKVYHVHGSIDSPKNMIVTSNNYFNFMSYESYFSRKLSTLLYENTIVILGYALNDNNLKSIFNNYKEFSKATMTSPNIILVTRRIIEKHIKDLYKKNYNMRVIDGVEIDEFFMELNSQIPKAKQCTQRSMENINYVMNGNLNKAYNKDYLRSSDSFFEIFSAMTSCGYNFNERIAQIKFLDIFDKKKSLTGEGGAWNQYRDLANWLTYFLMSIDISNFHNKEGFLKIVFHSFETMSEKLSLGYSWEAYSIWRQQWGDILEKNKDLISLYLEDKGKPINFK